MILDVVFEGGLFFHAVRNIGSRAALDVAITFRRPLLGLGGTREISAMPLFRNIAFLAPEKEIRTLLDSASSYFGRRQSALIEAEITFRDRAGASFRAAIRHSLRIYKELTYLPRPERKSDGIT